MITEITKERLCEYFYPTQHFERCTDGVVVDYAEIEINPTGIDKLKQNLDRYGNECDFYENDWKALHDPSSDIFEHIIAYVHFDTGTDNFNKLFIEVITAFSADELEVEKLINEEEKQNIINAALESLHKWRNTEYMLEG
jgi:hypothetical protein